MSLIGSWCDKCGIVIVLEEGCEVFPYSVNLCERESYLGISTFKGECLKEMLAGPNQRRI